MSRTLDMLLIVVVILRVQFSVFVIDELGSRFGQLHVSILGLEVPELLSKP